MTTNFLFIPSPFWIAVTAVLSLATMLATMLAVARRIPRGGSAVVLAGVLFGFSALVFIDAALWHEWDAMGYVVHEGFVATLGALIGLRAAPRQNRLGVLLAVCFVGLVGLLSTTLPITPRCGYRGLAFVDLAACFPLGVAHRWSPTHPIDRALVRWLGIHLALQGVYAAMWEVGKEPALFFGALAAFGWCALCVAVIAACRHR